MLSCTECRERLNDLLHGDFAPEEAELAAALSAHLDECEQCTRDIAELRAIRAELRAFKEVPAPPEVRFRVIAQLAADKAPKAAPPRKAAPRPLFVLPRRYAWAGGAFAAACCLLLLVQSPNFQKPTLPDPATLALHEATPDAATSTAADAPSASARMGAAGGGAGGNGNTKPESQPHTPQEKAAKATLEADTPVASQPVERVFQAPRSAPRVTPRTSSATPSHAARIERTAPPQATMAPKIVVPAPKTAAPTPPRQPNARPNGPEANAVPFSAAPNNSLAGGNSEDVRPANADAATVNNGTGNTGMAARATPPHAGAMMAPRGGPRVMAAQGATLGLNLTEGQAREIKMALTPDNDENAAQLRLTLPETLAFADDKNRGDDKLREKSRVLWRGAAQRGVALEATAEVVAVAPGERNVTLSLEKAETPGVVAANPPLQTSNLSVQVRPAPDANAETQAR